MGFSDSQHRKYFYEKEGKIVVGSKENVKYHDAFTGRLQGIKFTEKDVDFQKNGKMTKVKQWNIFFTDNSGDEYVWTTRYIGIIFQGFLNSILSLDEYSGLMKLSFYMKNDKTKLSIYYNGAKESLQWKYKLEEMPAVEKVMVNGKPYLDPNGNPVYNFDPRMEWTHIQVDKINAILGFDPTNSVVNGDAPELNEDEQPY